MLRTDNRQLIRVPRKQTMSLVTISGNTYPVKEKLKALGARWNPDAKAWMVASEKADEARALVSGASSKSTTTTGERPRYRPTRCAECGARASRYVRIYGYS